MGEQGMVGVMRRNRLYEIEGAHPPSDYAYEEMVYRFKRDTRHFAKRQLTWFRKEPGVVWLSIPEQQDLAQTVGQVVARIEPFLHGLE